MARLGLGFLLLAALGISSSAEGISGSLADAIAIGVQPGERIHELGHAVSKRQVRPANQDDQEVDEESKEAFRLARQFADQPNAANQNIGKTHSEDNSQRRDGFGADLSFRRRRSLESGNISPAHENSFYDFDTAHTDTEFLRRRHDGDLGLFGSHKRLVLSRGLIEQSPIEAEQFLKADGDGTTSKRMERQTDRKRPKNQKTPGKNPGFSKAVEASSSGWISDINLWSTLEGARDSTGRVKRHAHGEQRSHDDVGCHNRRKARPTTAITLKTTNTTPSPDDDAETIDEDDDDDNEGEEEGDLGALNKNRTVRSAPLFSCYPSYNVAPPRTTQRRQQGGGGAEKVDAIKAIVTEMLATIRAAAGAFGIGGGGGAAGSGGAPVSGGAGRAGAGGAGVGGTGQGGFGGGAGGTGGRGAGGVAAGGGAGTAGGTAGGGAGGGVGGGGAGGSGSGNAGGNIGTPARTRTRGRREAREDEESGQGPRKRGGRGGRGGDDMVDVGLGGGGKEGPKGPGWFGGMLPPKGQDSDVDRGDREFFPRGRERKERPERGMVDLEKVDQYFHHRPAQSDGKDGFFKKMWKKAKNFFSGGKKSEKDNANGNSTASEEQTTNSTARIKRGILDLVHKVKNKVMEKVNQTGLNLGSIRNLHQSGEAIFLARFDAVAESDARAVGAAQANREVNDIEENNEENSNTFPEPGRIDAGLRQKRSAVEPGDKIQGWLQSKLEGDVQSQRKSEDNKGLKENLRKISDLAKNVSQDGLKEIAKVGAGIAEMARGLATNITEKFSGKRGKKPRD